MAQRVFKVDAKLEIRDEKGNIMHQRFLVREDVWGRAGVYKTYLKCLRIAKDELLKPRTERLIRRAVCKKGA